MARAFLPRLAAVGQHSALTTVLTYSVRPVPCPVAHMSVRFVCPVCAGTVFEVAAVVGPDGHYKRTGAFQCAGCSVLFRDPEKFSAGRGHPPERPFTGDPRKLPPKPFDPKA